MADGKKSTTSSVYIPGDERSFVWEVTSAKVADANLPSRRIKFTRAVEDQ